MRLDETHVMMDLETLGTRAGCAILSVGLVSFTMGGRIGPGWHANISTESCVAAGLHIDPKTQAWWEAQSQEARDALLVDQVPLADAVNEAHYRFRQSGALCVWSQGAGFDAVIWEEACRQLGVTVPWRFYNVRDTRTIYALASVRGDDVLREGTHHNALDDARHQVRCVQLAANRLLRVNVS